MPEALTLLDRTYQLLDRDTRSVAVLTEQSGLPYHWLRKMKAHKIHNPGVRTVQTLLAFLETGERA